MIRLRKILLCMVLCLMLIGFAGPAYAVNDTEDTEESPDNIGDVMKNMSPVIRVESYTIEGTIEPGSEFVLKLDITNSNKYSDAYNIIIGYEVMIEDTFYIVEGEPNQIYIEYLAGGESVSRQIRIKVVDHVIYPLGVISFNYYYESEDGVSHENTTDISPEITISSQECEMAINNLLINETAAVNMDSLLTVQYSNTGEVDISNVVLTIQGGITGGVKTVELGTLSAGEQKILDEYIQFAEMGEQLLTVSFAYDDPAGLSYTTDEKRVVVRVAEQQEYTQTTDSNNVFTKIFDISSPAFAVSAGIVIAILLVAFIVSIIMHKRSKGR